MTSTNHYYAVALRDGHVGVESNGRLATFERWWYRGYSSFGGGMPRPYPKFGFTAESFVLATRDTRLGERFSGGLIVPASMVLPLLAEPESTWKRVETVYRCRAESFKSFFRRMHGNHLLYNDEYVSIYHAFGYDIEQHDLAHVIFKGCAYPTSKVNAKSIVLPDESVSGESEKHIVLDVIDRFGVGSYGGGLLLAPRVYACISSVLEADTGIAVRRINL